MDHSQTFPVVGAVPVPIAGPGTSQLLLPGGAGVGGESALPGIAGSGVYGSSLLRGAKDDDRIAAQRLCSGSQEGAPPAPFDGSDGGVSQTPFEPQSIGSSAISLSAQGGGHRASQSSLEHRHHLYCLLYTSPSPR